MKVMGRLRSGRVDVLGAVTFRDALRHTKTLRATIVNWLGVRSVILGWCIRKALYSPDMDENR